MQARVADECGECAQRNCCRWELVADARREGERGSGVAGGKRRGGRHPHVTRHRHLLRRAVWAPTPADRLHHEVDESARARGLNLTRARRLGNPLRTRFPGGLLLTRVRAVSLVEPQQARKRTASSRGYSRTSSEDQLFVELRSSMKGAPVNDRGEVQRANRRRSGRGLSFFHRLEASQRPRRVQICHPQRHPPRLSRPRP